MFSSPICFLFLFFQWKRSVTDVYKSLFSFLMQAFIIWISFHSENKKETEMAPITFVVTILLVSYMTKVVITYLKSSLSFSRDEMGEMASVVLWEWMAKRFVKRFNTESSNKLSEILLLTVFPYDSVSVPCSLYI